MIGMGSTALVAVVVLPRPAHPQKNCLLKTPLSSNTFLQKPILLQFTSLLARWICIIPSVAVARFWVTEHCSLMIMRRMTVNLQSIQCSCQACASHAQGPALVPGNPLSPFTMQSPTSWGVGCGSVGRASDWKARCHTDAGSDPWCIKGFFPQSTVSTKSPLMLIKSLREITGIRILCVH